MAADHPTPQDEMEHRLDDIEDEIQHARDEAKEHGTIPGKHHPTFIDPDNDQRVVDEDEHPGQNAPL